MYRASDLQSLPTTTAAALAPLVISILETPRGQIRDFNDQTMDSRSTFFASWCQRHDLHADTLLVLAPPALATVIACFLKAAQQGDNLKGIVPLAAKTLNGYLNAAITYLGSLGIPDPSRSSTHAAGTPVLHPLIADVLSHQSTWRPTRPPKEPLTGLMLQRLCQEFSSSLCHSPANLTLPAAIFDVIRLGFFTGSRAGELVQTKPRPSATFAIVPSTLAAGPWQGTPLALTRDDFEFFSEANVCLSWPQASAASHVRIRFRYDKSRRVGQFRTFKRVPTSPLCPVQAAVSLINRATRLAAPTGAPVTAYAPDTSQSTFRYLASDQVSQALRALVLRVYPDPAHRLHRNVSAFMMHSLRVTACLALWAAGFSEEQIAFRLRWHSDAIRLYIREAAFSVDAFTLAAARYAYSDV